MHEITLSEYWATHHNTTSHEQVLGKLCDVLQDIDKFFIKNIADSDIKIVKKLQDEAGSSNYLVCPISDNVCDFFRNIVFFTNGIVNATYMCFQDPRDVPWEDYPYYGFCDWQQDSQQRN